jgi:hypothetical protein
MPNVLLIELADSGCLSSRDPATQFQSEVDPRVALAKKHTAALEQLLKSLGAQAAKSLAEPLVRNCSQLLGHGETVLFETTF